VYYYFLVCYKCSVKLRLIYKLLLISFELFKCLDQLNIYRIYTHNTYKVYFVGLCEANLTFNY